MKHAYLIIAHNEFDVLERLIRALDDIRNDIFIHFDLKLDNIPTIKVKYSKLYLINERIDVRWGDLSVVRAEYSLFEEALKRGRYAYLHLLSGVDMPLKSQNYIHSFFEYNIGKEFVGFGQGDIEVEIERKMRRYHFFSKYFRTSSKLTSFLMRASRFLLLRLQYILNIKRNSGFVFKKGPQWVSITEDFAYHLVKQKSEVLKVYKNTFCCDEIFVQTICWNSTFQDRIFNITDEAVGSQRMIGWENGQLVEWQDEDYELLMESHLLFARKFNGENLDVLDRILKEIESQYKYGI
ncbi:beta-1,6-N-acetylglucosaminyltransferase [Pedobacter antarcticus]|uniref:beta-1,6-N-acetylglucosaminyltransferase n=1 Tax=Pedobacter antarcticus TaxID=34086 RepID=UPI0009425DA8|nr:beta-1,6-N-acetylglucosaminyltransferase [Pedobacter antarcticus]